MARAQRPKMGEGERQEETDDDMFAMFRFKVRAQDLVSGPSTNTLKCCRANGNARFFAQNLFFARTLFVRACTCELSGQKLGASGFYARSRVSKGVLKLLDHGLDVKGSNLVYPSILVLSRWCRVANSLYTIGRNARSHTRVKQRGAGIREFLARLVAESWSHLATAG